MAAYLFAASDFFFPQWRYDQRMFSTNLRILPAFLLILLTFLPPVRLKAVTPTIRLPDRLTLSLIMDNGNHIRLPDEKLPPDVSCHR